MTATLPMESSVAGRATERIGEAGTPLVERDAIAIHDDPPERDVVDLDVRRMPQPTSGEGRGEQKTGESLPHGPPANAQGDTPI